MCNKLILGNVYQTGSSSTAIFGSENWKGDILAVLLDSSRAGKYFAVVLLCWILLRVHVIIKLINKILILALKNFVVQEFYLYHVFYFMVVKNFNCYNYGRDVEAWNFYHGYFCFQEYWQHASGDSFRDSRTQYYKDWPEVSQTTLRT